MNSERLSLRIYLSGGIQKGSGDTTKKSVWMAEDIAALCNVLDPSINLLPLNPVSRSDDRSVFGRDCFRCMFPI